MLFKSATVAALKDGEQNIYDETSLFSRCMLLTRVSIGDHPFVIYLPFTLRSARDLFFVFNRRGCIELKADIGSIAERTSI